MLFTQSNVEIVLAGSAGEVERLGSSPAPPVAVLAVNVDRFRSIDGFLRAARCVRPMFVAGSGESLVDSERLRVGRAARGVPIDVRSFGGWAALDAFLIAESFECLADMVDEFSDTAS